MREGVHSAHPSTAFKPWNAALPRSLVLSCATNETDNPDLRDRAFIYWRLLSTDPEAAKDVVLSQKPVITDDMGKLDPELLDTLLKHLATLSSVYHKPPEMFVSRQRLAVQKAAEMPDRKFEEEESVPASGSAGGAAAAAAAASSSAPVVDLLGGSLDSAPAAPVAPKAAAGGLDDLLGGLDIGASTSAPAVAAAAQLPVLLSDPSNGVRIQGKVARQAGAATYALVITNNAPLPLDGLMLQTNRSTFGLGPANVVLQVSLRVMSQCWVAMWATPVGISNYCEIV